MSLRNQDTDLRTLRAAYKPLISKELGRRIDSEPETYYGDNGASREILARTNDVVRLTKALASGAGVKFAANTTLAAGLGRNSGDPKKFRSIGLAAANRAASLLANAATAGTGYHTGDPLFPYNYLGTSNFFNVDSFFGIGNGRTVIGDDPEDGLNTGRKLRDLYDKRFTEFIKKADDYTADERIVGTGNGTPETIANEQRRESTNHERPEEDTFLVNKPHQPLSKKLYRDGIPEALAPNTGVPSVDSTNRGAGDQGIALGTESLKERSENREDQISKVYTVNSKPSYDYRKRVDEFNRVDQLNLLGVTDKDLGDNSYDFINFKMVIKAPEEADSYLFFRSYLTDYNDNYDGQWSGVNYIGRAEPLYNYTGFNRQIGFNFMIAAGSQGELLPLYNKLNRLVSTTAPSYSSTFMRGVYVQLTIGDLLVDTPGFFNNLSLSWNTSYPWEVLPSEKKLPTVLDVSANFTPVHNFTPAYKESFINV